MIQDVDESLRALVKRDALNGSKADVAFDAPNKEWSSRRNTPTVDLYLYDIREDLDQREVMWEDIRGDSRASSTSRSHPHRTGRSPMSGRHWAVSSRPPSIWLSTRRSRSNWPFPPVPPSLKSPDSASRVPMVRVRTQPRR